MTRIIAVANQKGGVGKTTTSVNLAACLAATRRRVLLIDLDAQGNTTTGVGVDKDGLQHSGCNVLLGEVEPRQAILAIEGAGIDLIPANSDMTAAEVELRNRIVGELSLRNALETVAGDYDYVIIDCPPALSMLTLNALTAADGVLIPMHCEYYALEGLTALMDTVEKIRQAINPKLEVHGLLRTMYDPRNTLSRDVSDQLRSHFPELVFRTVIPRNVRLAEAPSHGLPVIQYDADCAGSRAYIALAGEVLRREQATPVAAA